MPVFVRAFRRGKSVVRSFYRNQKLSNKLANKLGSYKSPRIEKQRESLLKKLGAAQKTNQSKIYRKRIVGSNPRRPLQLTKKTRFGY